VDYNKIIQEFWKINLERNLSKSSCVFYLYIFYQCQLLNQNEVSLSFSDAQKLIGISKNTLTKIRNELKDNGIITTTTSGKTSTIYKLSNLSKIESINFDNVAELNNTNNQESFSPSNSKKKFQEIGKNSKTQAKTISNINIPTFSEFLEYAKTLEGYNPTMDITLSGKYEQWVANDWKNAFGHPIKSWKGSLKSSWVHIITDYKKSINFSKFDNLPNRKYPKSTYNE